VTVRRVAALYALAPWPAADYAAEQRKPMRRRARAPARCAGVLAREVSSAAHHHWSKVSLGVFVLDPENVVRSDFPRQAGQLG